MTSDRTRVTYTAAIPYKDLPSDRYLQGNLSRILNMDVRVESKAQVGDTVTNITIYAFKDGETLIGRQDLLE